MLALRVIDFFLLFASALRYTTIQRINAATREHGMTYGRFIDGLSKADTRTRVEELLARVGISKDIPPDTPINALSDVAMRAMPLILAPLPEAATRFFSCLS